MSQRLPRPVVVGVDGSKGSLSAAALAASEAETHRRTLLLISTFGPADAGAIDRRWDSHLSLVQAVRRIRPAHPTLITARRLVPGDLASALIDASHKAYLVVVGASREEAHGARASVAIGEAVAAHASTAVVVTRAGLSEVAGPILVGVDGSAAGASALEFAFAEAAVHGVAVHPTLVWTGAPGSALDTLDPFAYELTQAQEEADRLLAESVAGWSNKYPDVQVERAAVFDASVASALARLSGSAAMAVVCARSPPSLEPLAPRIGHPYPALVLRLPTGDRATTRQRLTRRLCSRRGGADWPIKNRRFGPAGGWSAGRR